MYSYAVFNKLNANWNNWYQKVPEGQGRIQAFNLFVFLCLFYMQPLIALG